MVEVVLLYAYNWERKNGAKDFQKWNIENDIQFAYFQMFYII